MTREEPPSNRPRRSAKERALGLLAVRWRSQAELERRLRAAGFESDEIEDAIADLERAGLVDDDRFARAVVADRAGRRLAGDRAIRSALLWKGVGAEVADRALEDAGDESARALALARRRAGRLSSVPPDAAYRRLFGLLVRRGFGSQVAREACRRALGEVFPQAEEPD